MNEKYTSLELSKKLAEAGCELESEKLWYRKSNGKWELVNREKGSVSEFAIEKGYKRYLSAYDILNDICVKYAKEFFGEKQPTRTNENEPWKGQICLHCKGDPDIGNPSGYCNHVHYPDSCEICTAKTRGWEYYSKKIFIMLQQGLKQEAEDYLWKHCLFNKNK